ncbi:MAG TPA: hypothetical protein VF079_04695 [Sphingomicrobium sp.]
MKRLGLFCIALAIGHAADAGAPRPPRPALPAERQYPFGGFLFTGSADALAKLRRYGESLGLKFSPYPESSSQPALLLPADIAFGHMNAVTDLVNRSQAGKFGEVRLGLVSEPPR